MTKTKKLSVGFDPKKPNRRFGHAIPEWALGLNGGGFVVVDGLKKTAVGRIVYLGREIDSLNVLEKVKGTHHLGIPDSEVICRIDRYLALVTKFKIGDLIRCDTGDEFRLVQASELSRTSKATPLP